MTKMCPRYIAIIKTKSAGQQKGSLISYYSSRAQKNGRLTDRVALCLHNYALPASGRRRGWSIKHKVSNLLQGGGGEKKVKSIYSCSLSKKVLLFVQKRYREELDASKPLL